MLGDRLHDLPPFLLAVELVNLPKPRAFPAAAPRSSRGAHTTRDEALVVVRCLSVAIDSPTKRRTADRTFSTAAISVINLCVDRPVV